MLPETNQHKESQLARGTYSEIIPEWLLLGPQPVRPADIAFLADAEGVRAIVSVRTLPTQQNKPTYRTRSVVWLLSAGVSLMRLSKRPEERTDRLSAKLVVRTPCENRTSRPCFACCLIARRRFPPRIERCSKSCAPMQLQQVEDARDWGVDVQALHEAMDEHNITFVRAEAVDFDSASLCKGLPKAAQALAQQLALQRKVYVHCTAGVHRSPAACVAYLHWFQGLALDEAEKYVKRRRVCDPDIEAVRAATQSLVCAQQGAGAPAAFGGLGRLLNWGANNNAFDSGAKEQLSGSDRRVIHDQLLGREHAGKQPALPEGDESLPEGSARQRPVLSKKARLKVLGRLQG